MCSPPQLSICGELFTQRTLYPCYPGYCPAWAAFRAWLLLPSPGEREKEPPLLLFRSHSIFPLANGAQTGEEKREKVGFFGVGVDGGREKEELWANKNTPGAGKGEGEKVWKAVEATDPKQIHWYVTTHVVWRDPVCPLLIHVQGRRGHNKPNNLVCWSGQVSTSPASAEEVLLRDATPPPPTNARKQDGGSSSSSLSLPCWTARVRCARTTEDATERGRRPPEAVGGRWMGRQQQQPLSFFSLPSTAPLPLSGNRIERCLGCGGAVVRIHSSAYGRWAGGKGSDGGKIGVERRRK